jgi:hypothetical protein
MSVDYLTGRSIVFKDGDIEDQKIGLSDDEATSVMSVSLAGDIDSEIEKSLFETSQLIWNGNVSVISGVLSVTAEVSELLTVLWRL